MTQEGVNAADVWNQPIKSIANVQYFIVLICGAFLCSRQVPGVVEIFSIEVEIA